MSFLFFLWVRERKLKRAGFVLLRCFMGIDFIEIWSFFFERGILKKIFFGWGDADSEIFFC